jgi:hypothetical protein
VRGKAALALATAVVVSAVAVDWAPWIRGPAPYPPEWRWERRVQPPSGSSLPAVACAAALVAALMASGTSLARRRPEAAARVLLGAATALGVVFQVALLEPEAGGHALQTLFSRATSRTGTSYYTVAQSPEAESPLAFVDHHAELLPTWRTAAKHAATHPPGPVLAFRGMIALAEASPRLTSALLDASDLPHENPLRAQPLHSAASRAGALLTGLAIALLAAATVWPIASLARAVGCGPLPAARLGALWVLLPAPALMLPQFDQAIALPITAASALMARAVLEPGRAALRAIAAGLLGGIALFFSYGAAAFLILAALPALALGRLRSTLPVLSVAAATTTVVFLLPILAGHEPVAAAWTALSIHREFYTAPRSYLLWLVFDPLDLAVFVGAPVALAWMAATASAAAAFARGSAGGWERVRLAVAVGLALLVLSGQARGEVGRIWLPIMPLLLLTALAAPEGDTRNRSTLRESVVVAVLSAVSTVAMRVFWHVP